MVLHQGAQRNSLGEHLRTKAVQWSQQGLSFCEPLDHRAEECWQVDLQEGLLYLELPPLAQAEEEAEMQVLLLSHESSSPSSTACWC